MTQRNFLVFAITLVWTASAYAAEQDPAGVEYFEKHIRPVLVSQCYECHSAKSKIPQGSLLLDSREGLLRGGDSGPALVPGKVNESLLIEVLHYGDDSYQMPPKGKLSAETIKHFEHWVKIGAPDPRTGKVVRSERKINLEEGRQFWAFQLPEPHQPPQVNRETWPQTEIDRFILSKLEQENITPVADTDRESLLRRVYFDLTGLPPTPEQIEDFLQDKSADALEKTIDRLLASPRYGEQWGRHWLDVARFAETSGGGRSLKFPNAWRYREYVIRSFNDDKPYNTFVQEQIAGDLLPAKNDDQAQQQLIAISYLLLGPTNFELQDKTQLRMDVIDEQLDTIGRTFLGMTIGCARCHDHKFDPIPTRDYYALAGIFRNTESYKGGLVGSIIEKELPGFPELRKKHEEYNKRIADLKKQSSLVSAKIAALKKDLASQKAKLDGPVAGGLIIDDAQAKLVGTWQKSTYDPNYVGKNYLHDNQEEKGKKSVIFAGNLPASGNYEIRLSYTAGANRAVNTPVIVKHPGGEKTIRINQKIKPPIANKFISLGKYDLNQQQVCEVIVSNADTSGYVIADAVQFVSLEKDVPKQAPQKQDLVKQKLVESLQADLTAENSKLASIKAKLKQAEKKKPSALPRTMVLIENPKVGDWHVHLRGQAYKLGPKVPRGFLQVAMRPDERPPQIGSTESGRLQLARWLARSDHPLTARVMVNRVWHHLLGVGLVRTTDNFGAMGERPSHPKLLDYLATRFVEEGWSIKKLIRMVMLSRVYQLSVSANPAAKKRDPENLLLWRANRRAVTAESIRDAILQTSGSLELTPPKSTLANVQGEYSHQFQGNYRSAYVPVLRNRLHDLFSVYDFANPNLVVGRRNVSTIPTQSLYMMNSPFVMKQSQLAAQRLLAMEGLDDTARLMLAYRQTLGRKPTSKEQQLCLQFLTGRGEKPEKNSKSKNQTESNPEVMAWANIYQTLFACVDFRYLK